MRHIFVLSLGIVFIGLTSLGEVVLQYWMWDPSIKDKYRAALDKFEEMHPNIKVELTAMEPKDYWTKMRLLARTGKLPDVFNMSSGFIEEWASKGLLLALDRFIESDPTFDIDAYYKRLFEIVRYPRGKGPIYAIPFAWVTTVLFFNKDAFDEVGLEYPNDSWDWCDFLRAAIKLTRDLDGDGEIDQWGFWFYGRYAHIEPWIYQNGGRLLTPDRRRFDPTPEALNALKFLTDLVLWYKVAPPKKAMEGVRQQDVFPRGLAAMWVDGSWNIENTRRIVGDSFRWGIAKVPRGPNWEQDVIFAWPDNIAISVSTKHLEEAWELVKFLSGPGLTIDLYMAGKVPSYRPLAESEEFLERGKQPAEKGLLLELGKLPMMNSFTLGWSEWRGYGPAAGLGLNGAIDSILNGEASFTEALEKAKEYINEVLARYYP